MPSVSNVAIGSNIAAAAATKARHGMNESIARLSTGIRAMYGADAAGHSVGSVHSAEAKSYAASTRNIEVGISYAQSGESVLLEVANLAQRIRELSIADDNVELLDANQIAALDAEATLLGDTIDNILNNTKFNGKEVVDSAAAASVRVNLTGDASTVTGTLVGPDVAALAGLTDASGAATNADTALASIATALGNIAADLTALKAFQGAASATSANLAAAGARIMDTDYATETASLTKNSFKPSSFINGSSG